MALIGALIVDPVFRGDADEMLDAVEEAFEQPFAGFASRRRAKSRTFVTPVRRLDVQLSFSGRERQTLQLEIAKPEADEIEIFPGALPVSRRL